MGILNHPIDRFYKSYSNLIAEDKYHAEGPETLQQQDRGRGGGLAGGGPEGEHHTEGARPSRQRFRTSRQGGAPRGQGGKHDLQHTRTRLIRAAAMVRGDQSISFPIYLASSHHGQGPNWHIIFSRG